MPVSGIDPFLIIAAVLPGLFICWHIYRADRYEHEPRWLLLLAMGIGALATMPIIQLEGWLSANDLLWQPHWLLRLMITAFFTALSEEVVKFTALMLFLFPSRYFDEPLDGIVYSVMIAMGFATTENILYALEYGLGTTILRAFTAVPAHLVFAVMMGYFVGAARFSSHRRNRMLLWAVLSAFAAHSIYNFLIVQKIYEGLVVLAVVFVWLAIYFEQDLIRKHQDRSPFKKM